LQDIRVVPLIEPGTESEEPIQCKYSPGNLTCDFTLGSRDDMEYFLFSLQEGESREFLAIKIQLLKRIKQKEKHIHKQLKQQQQRQHISPPPTKSKRAKTATWSVFKAPDKDKSTPKSPRKKSPIMVEEKEKKKMETSSRRSPRPERKHQPVSKKM